MKVQKKQRGIIKSLLNQSLVGLEIRVIDRTDPSIKNLRGCIIQESKSMIELQTPTGSKRIEKLGGIYQISAREFRFNITGKYLFGTIRTRSKRKYRDW